MEVSCTQKINVVVGCVFQLGSSQNRMLYQKVDMKKNLSESVVRNTRFLVALLLVGGFAIGWLSVRADHQMRKDLLVQTRLVAGAVDFERVKALTRSSSGFART